MSDDRPRGSTRSGPPGTAPLPASDETAPPGNARRTGEHHRLHGTQPIARDAEGTFPELPRQRSRQTGSFDEREFDEGLGLEDDWGDPPRRPAGQRPTQRRDALDSARGRTVGGYRQESTGAGHARTTGRHPQPTGRQRAQQSASVSRASGAHSASAGRADSGSYHAPRSPRSGTPPVSRETLHEHGVDATQLHLSDAGRSDSGLGDSGIRFTPGAGTPIVLEPRNTDAKQAIDGATRVAITRNFERVSPRGGDPKTTRALPSLPAILQRSVVAYVIALSVMAGGGGLSYLLLEMARAESGGIFSSVRDMTETFCVYGALPGVAAFWLGWLLLCGVLYFAIEHATRKALVAAAGVAALAVLGVALPENSTALFASWAIEGLPTDELGLGARNIPTRWPLLFVVYALGAFAARRGDPIPFGIAMILVLYLGAELHGQRIADWETLMREPTRLIGAGLVRGDAADAARLGIAGSREWLGLRAAGDAIMMMLPAWIYATARD